MIQLCVINFTQYLFGQQPKEDTLNAGSGPVVNHVSMGWWPYVCVLCTCVTAYCTYRLVQACGQGVIVNITMPQLSMTVPLSVRVADMSRSIRDSLTFRRARQHEATVDIEQGARGGDAVPSLRRRRVSKTVSLGETLSVPHVHEGGSTPAGASHSPRRPEHPQKIQGRNVPFYDKRPRRR